MMQNKPYKSVDPQVTIENIRNILFKCGIFLTEESIHTLDFYSSRLIISNDQLFNLGVGQNGKGMTPAYALVSAYGEFMERLQNYNIFVNGLACVQRENIIDSESSFIKNVIKNNLLLDFIFDPDEKRLSYDELTESQKNIFLKIADCNTLASRIVQLESSTKLLFAPFYCVIEECVEFLPIGLIYTLAKSNGMCAGNTKEEAILQGLCEIFERYVAKSIYKYEITPPSIPIEFFEGTKIYELIKKLESENNITIYVKDCSLGKGLPVVGLLVIDHESNSYAFHLGADPSPVIALERCFTELFQCRTLKDSLKPINLTKDPFEDPILSRKDRINEEFSKFIADGTGLLPNSILFSEYSYSFRGINTELNKSDIGDLSYFIGKIIELGYSLYIRDVSFLDFPSFFIYIPGMSDIANVYSQNDEYDRIKCNYSALYNIGNSTLEEKKQAIKILETDSREFVKLFPYNVSEDNFVNRYFLLSLVYYNLLDYTHSYQNLSLMLNSFSNDDVDNIYFLCARDFIFYKSKGLSDMDIIDKLKVVYKQNILLEVLEDLKDENNVFQYQNFPTCFDCESCRIRSKCLYLSVLKILKTIQERHKSNKIDQYGLKWISLISK